jgi:TfoX/Sxy family transcriptional regulator of competence genes
MSTRQSTIDFIVDQLTQLSGLRTKKMFGEYAIYYEEKVVALVCDDQLFVKITPKVKAFVGDRYVEGFAYPGAKPSIAIGAEDLENSERLETIIRMTAAALPKPAPKKSALPKPAPKKSELPKPAPKKSASPKPAPKKSASPKPAPKKSASPKPAPKKSAPKKSAPKKSAPKRSASPKSAPKRSASPKPAPKKSAPKKYAR